ncbi:MAG: hypothetical protein JWQ74_1201 [Marmoricola sp.]|nr:hypothetical protein [Marmoricola sp.]
MIVRSLLRTTALLLAVVLGAAACGASNVPVAGPAPASGSSAPTTPPAGDLTAVPTPTAPPKTTWPTGAWVVVDDKANDVRFQLPRKVKAELRSRPGMVDEIVGRVYKYQVGTGYKAGYLVVSVIRADATVRLDYARSSYEEAVKALESEGATDARLFDVRTASVPKGQALDSTLTYIAAGGSRTYWRQRTIILGTLVVQVQALGERLDERKIDKAFGRLTDSVVVG